MPSNAKPRRPANPMVRDTVLGFEHQAAVSAAVAGGDARRNTPAKALIAVPRLVRSAKITPRPDGSAVLVFDEGEKQLTLDLTAQRLHLFMAAILDIAGTAEWDLPPLAAWLEGSSLATPAKLRRRLCIEPRGDMDGTGGGAGGAGVVAGCLPHDTRRLGQTGRRRRVIAGRYADLQLPSGGDGLSARCRAWLPTIAHVERLFGWPDGARLFDAGQCCRCHEFGHDRCARCPAIAGELYDRARLAPDAAAVAARPERRLFNRAADRPAPCGGRRRAGSASGRWQARPAAAGAESACRARCRDRAPSDPGRCRARCGTTDTA